MEVTKQLIAFCHFKGGVGATFLAANTAIAISRKRILTCLIDFDCKLPNCHNVLGIKVSPKDSMYSFLKNSNPDDVVNFFLNNDKLSENLYLLSSSSEEQIEVLEDINDNKDDIGDILKTTGELFNITVVDLPVDYQNPQVIDVLTKADKVFVVGDQDVNTLENTMRCLDMCRDIDISLSKFSYVLNKYIDGYEVDVKTIKQMLPIRVTEPVPFDYELALRSIAKSQYICEQKNKVGKALDGIVNVILVGIQFQKEQEKKKGIFGLGKSKKSKAKAPAGEDVKFVISEDDPDVVADDESDE